MNSEAYRSPAGITAKFRAIDTFFNSSCTNVEIAPAGIPTAEF
jgi:hypothetical protein